MAITKPPVLPSWAEAGDKVKPSNAEIQAGWPLSSIPPSRQRFNWLLNFLANGIRYFSRRGLPDYDAAEIYMIGDRIIGDDGKTYRSLVDNNTGQTPSAQPTKWEEWAPSLSRLADLLQKQTYTAFTTAGAAPNFTLTPSPAITAYSANQRFRVKFHAAGTGADVMSVNALGDKNLKQYDSTGAKVAAVITANMLVDVEYDGVDFVLLDRLPLAHGQQKFTANGNFTVPAGITTVYVTLAAGGGGGAGSLSAAPYAGGGGGAGEVKYRVPVAVTPGQVIAVTIGQGGAPGSGTTYGGTYANSNGSAGTASSFGALLTATPGGGGRCQSGESSGGPAGGELSSYGADGGTSESLGGAGGGNFFAAPSFGDYNQLGGVGNLYGGGGAGGRASGYWQSGGAGAAGICIVEW